MIQKTRGALAGRNNLKVGRSLTSSSLIDPQRRKLRPSKCAALESASDLSISATACMLGPFRGHHGRGLIEARTRQPRTRRTRGPSAAITAAASLKRSSQPVSQGRMRRSPFRGHHGRGLIEAGASDGSACWIDRPSAAITAAASLKRDARNGEGRKEKDPSAAITAAASLKREETKGLTVSSATFRGHHGRGLIEAGGTTHGRGLIEAVNSQRDFVIFSTGPSAAITAAASLKR